MKKIKSEHKFEFVHDKHVPSPRPSLMDLIFLHFWRVCRVFFLWRYRSAASSIRSVPERNVQAQLWCLSSFLKQRREKEEKSSSTFTKIEWKHSLLGSARRPEAGNIIWQLLFFLKHMHHNIDSVSVLALLSLSRRLCLFVSMKNPWVTSHLKTSVISSLYWSASTSNFTLIVKVHWLWALAFSPSVRAARSLLGQDENTQKKLLFSLIAHKQNNFSHRIASPHWSCN